MKKLIATILAVLYLGTSSGFTIHIHYCMGKQTDWGLSQNKSGICSGCGMKNIESKDNGCCKDEHKVVKNDTDQKITEKSLQLLKGITLPFSFIEISIFNFHSVKEKNPDSHIPPQSGGVAVYIRNCVFLI